MIRLGSDKNLSGTAIARFKKNDPQRQFQKKIYQEGKYGIPVVQPSHAESTVMVIMVAMDIMIVTVVMAIIIILFMVAIVMVVMVVMRIIVIMVIMEVMLIMVAMLYRTDRTDSKFTLQVT